MEIRNLQIMQPLCNIKWDIENQRGIVEFDKIAYNDFLILVHRIEKLMPKKVKEVR